jgi:predicted ATPase
LICFIEVSSHTTHFDILSPLTLIVGKMKSYGNDYGTSSGKEAYSFKETGGAVQRTSVYIISGGPGCGKTTIINGLKSLGYYTLPETAEQVIYGEIEYGGEILPWNKARYSDFQRAVYSLQKIQERRIPEYTLAISDRSLWDVVAYARFGDVEVPKGIEKDLEKAPYKTVFIPDRLPTLEKTSIRREDEKKSEDLHKIIGDVYDESGLEVVRVPVFGTKQERVDYVKSYLEREDLSKLISQIPTLGQSTA